TPWRCRIVFAVSRVFQVTVHHLGSCTEPCGGQMPGLRTTAVHGGRDDLAELGVHAPPIDLSTTYPIPDQATGGAALGAWADGASEADSPVYARLHNPTVARFERALAELEGTDTAVAFSSGMAAITAVVQAACVMAGKPHVVAVRPVYGGTDHLLTTGLLGTTTTYVSADEVSSDRKSTRLNSSHVKISYAVFCLKKKT